MGAGVNCAFAQRTLPVIIIVFYFLFAIMPVCCCFRHHSLILTCYFMPVLPVLSAPVTTSRQCFFSNSQSLCLRSPSTLRHHISTTSSRCLQRETASFFLTSEPILQNAQRRLIGASGLDRCVDEHAVLGVVCLQGRCCTLLAHVTAACLGSSPWHTPAAAAAAAASELLLFLLVAAQTLW
jgi:hypothetical protein